MITQTTVSAERIRAHRDAITRTGQDTEDAYLEVKQAFNGLAEAIDEFVVAYNGSVDEVNLLGRYLDTLIGEGPAEPTSGLSAADVIVNAAFGKVRDVAGFASAFSQALNSGRIRNAGAFGDRATGC